MEASCNEVVPTKSRDLWRLTNHFLIMSQSREMWRLSSGGSRGVRPGGGTRTGGSGAGAGTTEQLGDTGPIPSGGAWNSWHSVHAHSKGGRKAAPATRPRRIGATVRSSSTRRGSPQRDSAGERSAGPTQSRALEGSRSSPSPCPGSGRTSTPTRNRGVERETRLELATSSLEGMFMDSNSASGERPFRARYFHFFAPRAEWAYRARDSLMLLLKPSGSRTSSAPLQPEDTGHEDRAPATGPCGPASVTGNGVARRRSPGVMRSLTDAFHPSRAGHRGSAGRRRGAGCRRSRCRSRTGSPGR